MLGHIEETVSHSFSRTSVQHRTAFVYRQQRGRFNIAAMASLPACLLVLVIISLLGHETHQFPANKQVLDCGSPSMKYRRGKRIVGGTQAYAGKWPWIAALIHNNSQYCAGSIVGEKWIATTSHCFHNHHSSVHAKDWLVKVGKFNLKVKEQNEQVSKVKRIIRHPNYISMWDDHQVDVPDDNDVAMLELESPIKYTKYVKPVCIQHGHHMNFTAGETCTVAGWGHTKYNGKVQQKLRDVDVELVSRERCNSPQSYNGSIHERAICAGYENGGRDACQYDSGGPLLCLRDKQWYLVGQVSWGDKCALPHKYGVYSNMKVLTPWLVKIMATN